MHWGIGKRNSEALSKLPYNTFVNRWGNWWYNWTYSTKYIFDLFLKFFPIPVGKLSYSPAYFILGIILCVLFTVVGSYISINKILKSSPVLLMNNEVKSKKVNKIERKINLSKFKFKTKFAIREQLRSIPRLVFW
ncbi:hypothetical protein QJS64_14510 [Paraclostridium bifermentans]|uniref:Uncharacterized protein n=1 Tax=Paraclostridium bifermentans TaxID=1490 RepID=A0ABY8R161_PARBF|nr:hypothetical protein QJS64_14510 [Paraclostridium bifermentans]